MHTIRNSYRLISFLLLLAFTAIQGVQMVHHHHEFGHSVTKITSKQQSAHQLDKAGIKCKICYFFQKNTSKHFDLPPNSALVFYKVEIPNVDLIYTDRLVQAFIQTLTNKGPPLA